ncbi:related to SGV1-Cyclin-dependent protein kinase [Sporisorium scitamineum]|uniref:Related to SGV1-Cyclin-dependent protein kinase n=1 Tax=Sporisorium scitamineum TaxID=49012 RepID=A0A0F7RU69_9BASI|nr:hypothetical protein [Sporisorium scitamineum]CDU23012.1 related to SGV1-Cyclin-dependent protein kinase [Sporisorium scitamineum]
MSLLASFDDALAAPSSSSHTTRRKQALVGGLFSHAESSSPSIDWDRVTLTDLTSHSHGLCSSVYRRALTSSAKWPYNHTLSDAGGSSSSFPPTLSQAVEQADGLAGWICIKRVQADEQPRPHSISREVALLDQLLHRNVAPLLAAIYDTSDPFGAVVDLVMPLYAATLEEALLEPSLASSPEVNTGELSRPGKSISHLWSTSQQDFVHSVSKQLLAGIVYLHDNNVAHRDVKPSNILLSHTGVVKIIDLGTAYTTAVLKDPLASDESSSARRKDEEEWNGGKMVCQVGTGQFRAPELLFSPVGGYDAFAVDIWAVGVTLAHFFTPLTAVLPADSLGQQQDERKDWQKAFDSNTPLSPSSNASTSSLYWEEDPLPSDPDSDSGTASGYIRTPFFHDTGDIGLAASIFSLLGLPASIQDWPEAEHFQPPLERLPFAPSQGKGLLSALTLVNHPERSPQEKQGLEGLSSLVHNVILPALNLSASKRPKARSLLAAIQSSPVST